MKKFLLVLVCVSLSFPGFSKKIGGVTLPDTLKAGETSLMLNGAGLRKKLWIKVYAGGLYLTKKSNNQNQIINADEPMAIKMVFIHDGVAAEKLIGAWNEGFEAATGGKIDSIKAKIDAFNGYFTDEAHEGDIYDIIYVPGEGTTLSIKGDVKGTIEGLDFKKALFGIWLCDTPADEDLKEGMLDK